MKDNKLHEGMAVQRMKETISMGLGFAGAHDRRTFQFTYALGSTVKGGAAIDRCQKKAIIRKRKRMAQKKDAGAKQADVGGAETDAITDFPEGATLISKFPKSNDISLINRYGFS